MGQAAVEFAVAFLAVVLLVFGIIQLAFIYQGRSTLNYATTLAARAGALHNGDPGAMRNALARGLAPLFAAKASPEGYSQALEKALNEATLATNIEILNPTKAAMSDFGRPRLDGQQGQELPNDTLSYRSPTPGSSSGLSIQDANLLHLRVTYCFRLIVPIIDRMLHSALHDDGSSASSAGNMMTDPFGTGGVVQPTSCSNPSLRGIRIQMRSEAIVRMQSSFYAANLQAANGGGGTGGGSPGTPGTPPDRDSPPGTGNPGGPGNPGDEDPDPPIDEGDPQCF